MKISVHEIDTGHDFDIVGVSYAGAPSPNTAMFVTKKVQHLLSSFTDVKQCLVFVETGAEVPAGAFSGNAIVFSDTPQLAYARFATKLYDSERARRAKLKYTLTEGGYYLGSNVVIGENAYIEPGVFIDHDVVIGKNATILFGSSIRCAVIGDNFVCNEHAAVGDMSYTMALDEHENKYRIPSLGKVIIGNDVEIGTCNHIERGMCGDTVIEDYAKLDGYITLGHEAHVGKNVEIVAGSTIGGFVSIGEKTFIGLNATVKNRISIGSNAVVGMGAVVIKSVEDGATVVGNPARPLEKK